MDKRKKILFLITQSSLGGAQKYVFDLASNLDKERFDVTVAGGPPRLAEGRREAGSGGELFKKLEPYGVKTVSLKWMKREVINPFADLLGLWEIYRLLKKERPDVVHLNSSKAGFSGSIAARLAGVKVVYTVHGAVFEAAFSWKMRKLFLLLEKFSAPFKNKIVCVSEKDRELWLKHKAAPAEKLVVIHNGINLDIGFAPKQEARQKLLEKYSFPLFSKEGLGEIYLVGSIGYFYPEKNYSALIKAADLISKLPAQQNKKKVLFLINGDGQQRPALKDLIKERGLQNVFFLPGAIWPGSKYLKAFNVFVLPSVKEGLPYTILEAMAAGVPVVASNVGGIPEMIQDNVNGFLVAPNDHEALAEKILQLLENPALAQRFANASLEKIKEFSLEQMVKKTEQLY